MGKLSPVEHAERGEQATRRARAALKAKRARAEYLRSLTDFELELLQSRCPRHTMLAVCDECCETRSSTGRDSTGFPSASLYSGLGRYRVCERCDKLAGIDEWSFELRCCARCAGKNGATAAALPNPAAAPRWRITAQR